VTYHDEEEREGAASSRRGLWCDAALRTLSATHGDYKTAIHAADAVLVNFDLRFPEVLGASGRKGLDEDEDEFDEDDGRSE
jgi:hypothetical protein